MKVYGLTGGIATGKSTVEQALRGLGIPTLDADVFARRVVEPGQPAHAEIAEEFGPGVLDTAGRIDRPALARLVYRDPVKRHRLEQITHPRIMGAIWDEVTRLEREDHPIVVVSAALLVEAGYHRRFDGLVVVWCGAEEQMTRVVARDELDETQARRRIEAQMPMGDKIAVADWTIDTNGTRGQTAEQVLALVQEWRRAIPSTPDA